MKLGRRYDFSWPRAAGLCLLLLGCAATEHPVWFPAPDLYWPPPPEKAEARYLGALPDKLMTPVPRSFWGKAWDVIIGTSRKPVSTEPLLGRPFGIAARGDDLWVADPGGRQLVHVGWRKHEFNPIVCEGRTWGTPMGVTVDPSGTLYVADSDAAVLVRIDKSGKCSEIGRGSLSRPTGVALSAGDLFAVDPPSHAVVAFSADGRELYRFGGHGETNGALNFPTGIAARPDGSLLVVDSLNFRVVAYSREGKFIESFGEAGDGSGAFGRPKAVSVDETGRIFVSDTRHDVIIVFDAHGTFEFAIGGSGDGPGQLTLPAGVALSGDMLFVADSYNRRVAAYQLLGGGT